MNKFFSAIFATIGVFLVTMAVADNFTVLKLFLISFSSVLFLVSGFLANKSEDNERRESV